jgi:hypothetical protein
MKLTFHMVINKERARDTGMALTFLLIILELWLGGGLYLKLAAVSILITMIYPLVFKPLAYLWFGIGQLLGSVTSRVLLTVIFMVMVLPVALILRLLGKDPLLLRQWKKGNVSVFITRDHTYSQVDLDKPY